jgi:hypothetical protein
LQGTKAPKIAGKPISCALPHPQNGNDPARTLSITAVTGNSGMIVNDFMLPRIIVLLSQTAAVPRSHLSLRVLAIVASGLFTLAPAMAQPMQLPGAATPSPAGATQAPPAAGPLSAPRKAAPAVVKAPTEEAVLDRTYRRNGATGEARLERIGTGYGLRLTAEGFQTANLTEACAVSFGDKPLPLKSLGKPTGLPRYELEAPICPIVFDVLDGALLVSAPAQPCVIEAAQCRIDPRGLWGPDSRTLAAQAKDIERTRSRAESALREGYKTLTARASVPDQRMIAREQAGFSSERELVCRDFVREGSHGFCAAKLTEARAAELRMRTSGPGGDKPVKKKKPKPVAKPASGSGPLQLQN